MIQILLPEWCSNAERLGVLWLEAWFFTSAVGKVAAPISLPTPPPSLWSSITAMV